MRPIEMHKKWKYGNIKKFYMWITFDSKKEFERYVLLRDMEKRWLISDLQCHVKFPLIESFKHRGQTILWVSYEADFVYKDSEQNVIVEDVKSEITQQNSVYIIKKKLLLKLNPDMDFREII